MESTIPDGPARVDRSLQSCLQANLEGSHLCYYRSHCAFFGSVGLKVITTRVLANGLVSPSLGNCLLDCDQRWLSICFQDDLPVTQRIYPSRDFVDDGAISNPFALD